MFKSVFALAAIAVAAPALAQDASVDAGAFNGPFVGIQGGWQQDRQTLEVGNLESSSKGDGFAYGAQIGWDGRIGTSAVIGAEVAVTGRSGETRFDDFDLKQGRTISATARLGFMTDPAGLVYARGGYANARFTADDGFGRQGENRDGYTVGAGYERMLGRNVSARLEYGYSDFGSDRINLTQAGIPGTGGNAELDYSRHAVTAGLNFRF